MSRVERILLVLIGVQLVAGAGLAARQVALPVPPLPRVELFDPITADQLRHRREQVRPSVAGDWAGLAELYLAHGFYPEAEACQRRACELAPRDARLRGLWAFCLSRMGQMERAIELFEQAVDQGHPEADALWYFVGRDYLRLERVDQARAAFLRAGDLPGAHYELAKLDILAGNPELAVGRLEPLQSRFPKALPPHWLRGRAEWLLGNQEAADMFARRAAEANERLPTPFDDQSARVVRVNREFGRSQRLADARPLIDKQQLAAAQQVLEAIQRARWSPEAADLQAEVAMGEGRFDEACRLLEQVIQRDGPTLHWLWRYGDALQEAGRESQACQAWRHALSLGPETEAKGLLVKLSQYHERQGEGHEAGRLRGRFYYLAGLELLRQGEPGPGRASLEESVRIDAENADAWFYLGECHRLQDAPAEARRAYQRCLLLRPEHGRALESVSDVSPR